MSNLNSIQRRLMTTPYRLNRTVGPSSLALTVAQAKKQLELQPTGSVHDDQLTDSIEAATEQVEHDTGYCLITSTYTLTLDEFPDNIYTDTIQLPIRPIQSITSITYPDEDNTTQTLSTDVYDLSKADRQVHLKYDQDWPSIAPQRRGIVITLVAGYGTATNVPRILRQAMLLQVAKWFIDRDMMLANPQMDASYERIIRKIQTPHYP